MARLAGGSIIKRGRRRPLFIAICALFAAQMAVADVPPPQRQKELVRLVRHDCGSCHGLTLAGGLGPPLQPAVLRDKPLESLTATVIYGRPGTPMPPWGAFLSESEAKWIVEMLVKGFPGEN